MLPFFKNRKKLCDKSQKINNLTKIPHHIAIIMDGNSRWAKLKGLPTKIGHKTGAENVAKITEKCIEFSIPFLTIYAFSSENWPRPKEEVNYLLELLDHYLESEGQNLIEKNIKVLISGDLTLIPERLVKKIKKIEFLTKNNSAITLNVAFSYGGRQEIVNATRRIAASYQKGDIELSEINEEIFSQNLFQPQIPDPDLLIRTAGDLRLSNFMLWQLAYSELYFTSKFWPDFDANELVSAIYEFNSRERRYGTRKSI